jgi:hypothetical protein
VVAVPPLLPEHVDAFLAFAEAAPPITPPGAISPWSFADAVKVAGNVSRAFGRIPLAAGIPDAEPLCWWASFPENRWPLCPPLLIDPVVVAQLNDWVRVRVKAFYAQLAAGDRSPVPLPAQPAVEPATFEQSAVEPVAYVPTLDEGIEELMLRIRPPRRTS